MKLKGQELAPLLPFLLLLALLAVPVYSKGHDDHDGTIEMAANQTSQCNPCCRGPPGRDGRDGPPGPTSPIAHQDYLNIRKELEQELKTKMLTELGQNLTATTRTKVGIDCKDIGKTLNNPASSCKAIFLCDEETPLGQYWIQGQLNNGNAVIKRVHCNMKDTKCGIRGGWMRVAHIDVTNQSATCPPPLRTITSPKRMCGRSTVGAGCSSVQFSTGGVPYTRVCGRAVGYAHHSPDAFQPKANGINGVYVDGLSITHGQPRKHLWTYAAGYSESQQHTSDCCNCPCARYPGKSAPSFVGNHFHCESANKRSSGVDTKWHTDDPLWDGRDCAALSGCCSTSGLPWFCRTLPCQTTDDIEVRWCADEGLGSDDVSTEILEIFVM